MTTEQDILRFLGLARRAGRIASGSDSVIGALEDGQAKLLIISKDCSPNTVNRILDNITYEIPMYRFSQMNDIGHAIGTAPRGVLAVTDEGFALKLDMKLTDYKDEEDRS